MYAMLVICNKLYINYNTYISTYKHNYFRYTAYLYDPKFSDKFDCTITIIYNSNNYLVHNTLML